MYDKPVYWLNELRRDAHGYVGEDCANLGEMTNMGIQVPQGFALSVLAHDIFLKESRVRDMIYRRLSPSLEEVKESAEPDMKQLKKVSAEIHEKITGQAMPPSLRELVATYYQELCKQCGSENIPVAVRSSRAVSKPGPMETYLIARGQEEVIQKIKEVWASAYTAQAIHYRLKHEGMRGKEAEIGVAILRMVDARCGGVSSTANPVDGDTTKVAVEANWGIGESIALGLVISDVYYIAKDSLNVERVDIGKKLNYCELSEQGTVLKQVPEEKQSIPCLNEEEAIELAKTAIALEEHFQAAQDIEWAIDRDSPFPTNLYIVWARPCDYIPDQNV